MQIVDDVSEFEVEVGFGLDEDAGGGGGFEGGGFEREAAYDEGEVLQKFVLGLGDFAVGDEGGVLVGEGEHQAALAEGLRLGQGVLR